jgi:hypothetical protein
MCPYPSTCSLNTAEFDVCECFTGSLADGAVGLRFECSSSCSYDASSFEFDAAVPEGGTIYVGDATVTGVPDASPPDARPADAIADSRSE